MRPGAGEPPLLWVKRWSSFHPLPALLFMLALLLQSCATKGVLTRYSAMSERPVPIDTSGTERIQGKSCMHIVMFIPTTGFTNRDVIGEALDNAFASRPGANAIINADISIEIFPWLNPIYTKTCAVIEGYPTTLMAGSGSARGDNDSGTTEPVTGNSSLEKSGSSPTQ